MLPQVACFDTAFHRTMPELARRFALPRDLSESGVERYGFHGLSYEYIAGALREHAPDLAMGRVVIAHLGNGASLCALRAGRSVDTTMGFTALDGLPMGTRCGAIDPGVLLYLQQARGMDAAAVEDLLYHRCGLLGVSGVSADMRTLIASGDPHAAAAIELFCWHIARQTAALTVALGGLDGIVFTAGIGAHTPLVRARACAHLSWLGAAIDDAANARGDRRISSADSRIAVLVIPTDEEAMIARHTQAVLTTAHG
jgi:acetate kinase